ncbi:hypothetical protein diail_10315 [Diaporthe ilicicola]|nr:hypothetical protein diail_10315 [Diaporthe ilicicola]
MAPKSEAGPPRLSGDLDIERFVRVQDRKVDTEQQQAETEYESAIREIQEGKKQNEWVLFIFPRVYGLGKHINSVFYGIGTMKEAKAYLAHPVLGPRLHAATEAVLGSGEDDLRKLFGNSEEASMFKSSMTLFAQVCQGTSDELFLRSIIKYWGGVRDDKTLRIMESW